MITRLTKRPVSFKKTNLKNDLALLGYNAAGPYPSCFENLSENERKDEHHRILKKEILNTCVK